MYEPLIYTYVLILGVIIGSFLNVCIWRIPRKEGIVIAPSHCVNCGARIKPYDLIPVASYIILLGRCRNCKAKISFQYPAVELLTGLGFVFLYWFYGLSVTLIFFLALYAALVALSFIDAEHRIIPDGIIIFLLTAGLLYNIVSFDLSAAISSAIGFFAASVPLYILAMVTNGGMGGGDIKFMAVCGLFLGWERILLAMFAGAVFACIAVLIGMLFKLREKKRTVVFGPFLSAGVMLSLLYGERIIGMYLKILGISS